MLEVSLVGTEIGSIAVIPARFLVNIFPWLMHVPKWFPGAGWKHTGEEWRKVVTEMVEVPYNIVKKAEAEGTAKPSFALQMMREETTLDEKTLMKTGASTCMCLFQCPVDSPLTSPFCSHCWSRANCCNCPAVHLRHDLPPTRLQETPRGD